MMKKLLLVALLATAAHADPRFNLKDYKTVAVQPVLGAHGFVAGDLAAIATEAVPPNPKLAKTSAALLDGKGFGFAGKATGADLQLLGVGLSTGMNPTLLKADPAAAKEQAAQVRALLPKLKGKVDASVLAKLEAALALGEAGDFAGSMKTLIDAMMGSVEAITKGTERTHAYLAVGLYIGIAIAFTESGKQSATLASLVDPLARMLREDALMGGADRAIAAQLEVIGADLASEKPTTEKLAEAVRAIAQTKPD